MVSPCKGCENELKDKKACMPSCPKIAAFQRGLLAGHAIHDPSDPEWKFPGRSSQIRTANFYIGRGPVIY